MQRSDEPISALADGELDTRGAEFLIRRIGRDGELNRRWQRIHLVRACLQREFSAPVSLVARVAAAIDSEPAPKGAGFGPSSLLRVGAGGAIAAGVALVAVIGLGNRVETGPASVDEEAPGFVSQSTALDRQFSPTPVPAGLGAGRQATATRAGGTGAASQRQINRYMLRHSQLAGESGFVSFTPVLTAPSTVQVSAEPPDEERAEARPEPRQR